MTVARASHVTAVASLICLIALCVVWELWLAPLRPGGSWVVLKVLPLLAPLFGVLRERRYTYRWAVMLVLGYFIEGVVRAYADAGRSAVLAGIEVVLSLTFVIAAALFVRSTRAPQRSD